MPAFPVQAESVLSQGNNIRAAKVLRFVGWSGWTAPAIVMTSFREPVVNDAVERLIIEIEEEHPGRGWPTIDCWGGYQ